MLFDSPAVSSPVAANVERFSGFAECYDAHRPSPPPALVDVLTQLAQAARPRLVVDIGSGTGLSTRIWNDRAEQIIGIEPNDPMRAQAMHRSDGASNISFRAGHSSDTGLPDACADIVTCCQSLHWMDPSPTFVEIARILRPGGIFAACDADWPPTMNWQAEAAYRGFETRIHKLEDAHGVSREVQRWAKHDHLKRIESSGQFRFSKEIVLHHIEPGNADRFVGLALSQGSVEALLKSRLTEEEIGLDALREAAAQLLGDQPMPWCFSYRVRVAVK